MYKSFMLMMMFLHLVDVDKQQNPKLRFKPMRFKIDFNSRYRNSLFNKYEETFPQLSDFSPDIDIEPRSGGEPQYLENIDILSKGYDIFIGDPHNPPDDPGIKLGPMFNFSYNEKHITSDNRWIIPDYVSFIIQSSGAVSTESSEIFGETSYQESTKFAVELEGNEVSSKFTTGNNFNERSNDTRIKKYILYTSSAIAIRYLVEHMSTYPDKFFNLNADLQLQVGAIPLTDDNNTKIHLKSLVAKYGTHFIRKAAMGARILIISEITRENYMKLIEIGVDVKKAASLAVSRLFSGKYPLALGGDMVSDSQKFLEHQVKSIEMFRGTPPAKNSGFDDWVKAAYSTPPFPIKMYLRPLTDLFSTHNFPNISSKDLETKKAIVKKFMEEEYCNVFLAQKRCRNAATDEPLPVVHFTTTTTTTPTQITPLTFSGPFGTWYEENYCKEGGFIAAFRVSGPDGGAFTDDLGVSQIVFYCSPHEVLKTPEMLYDAGHSGPLQTCQGGFIGAQTRILGPVSPVFSDNVGMSCLKLICSNGTKMQTRCWDYESMGSLSEEKRCPDGLKIRGFQALFQPYQGTGPDDTAMNGITLFCF